MKRRFGTGKQIEDGSRHKHTGTDNGIEGHVDISDLEVIMVKHRKVSAYSRCIGKRLKGHKGGKAAFRKAAKACKGKGHKHKGRC